MPALVVLEMACMNFMTSSHDRHHDSQSDVLPVPCSSGRDILEML